MTNMSTKSSDDLFDSQHAPNGLSPVVRRIESEYAEMPGLSVTEMQARRLWDLDARDVPHRPDHARAAKIPAKNGERDVRSGGLTAWARHSHPLRCGVDRSHSAQMDAHTVVIQG